MNKIDYQALREAAEKATCGVWSLEYVEERFDAGDALIHREVVGYLPICRIEGAHPESGFDEDFQMEQQANAEFITAANPATVLELLDELEAAKKRIAELEAEPVSQTCKLNEPSGNYPVTPDGWISCSEQMPIIGELNLRTGFPLLITCEIGVIPAYYGFVSVNGDKHYGFMESFKYGDDRGGHPKTNEYGLISNVTHWMPLPEPPRLKEL
ncbi:ead/Ea22-like family protein [Escherichia coli]|nr:ead/Ea22-like family protein [Escherichia coli]